MEMMPLNTLKIDPLNVRATGKGTIQSGLYTSIATLGLKVPLIVRKNGSGFTVIDGGQRLTALQELAKDKKIAADQHVPCIIEGGLTDSEVREASLALNVVRRAMHPVDEYRAVKTIIDERPDDPRVMDDVGLHLGLSTKQVNQALALGRLHDKVLDAWIAGDITSESAEAFTLVTSKKRQAQLLKDGFVAPWQIKREIRADDRSVQGKLRFVGPQVYMERGGKIVFDLFGDSDTPNDLELLEDMVEETLHSIREGLAAEGWSWVTDAKEFEPWECTKIKPKFEPTPAEQKKIDKLEKQIAASANEYDSEDQEELLAALCDVIADRGYTDKDRKKGGCIVRLLWRGNLEITRGLIKPTKAKKVKKPSPVAGADAGTEPATKEISQALKKRLNEQYYNGVVAAIKAHQHSAGMGTLMAAIVVGQIHPAQYGNVAPLRILDQLDTIINLIKPKIVNEKMYAAFEAKDYFDSLSKPQLHAVMTEALGKDKADEVKDKKKSEISSYACGKILHTDWLPEELRTKHYNG